MYIPKANEEIRLPVLLEMIHTHPLASLVTLGATGLNASHIPMVHEPGGSDFGILRGHVSRANPQWKDPADTLDSLAIFSGPQHYISAGWYPGKLEDGKEVPTWNYIVVHAYGKIRVIHDHDWLLNHLRSLTNQQEASFPNPWKVEDAPTDFTASQIKGIVGYELPIARIEGRWKLSQNRIERDRKAVEQALDALKTPESRHMRDLIESRAPKP